MTKGFKHTHENKGRQCSVTECTKPSHSHGMCSMHNSRMIRHGDVSVSDRTFWFDDQRRFMYSNAKSRSKSLGVPFDLEPADIVIPNVCPVLGIPLIASRGNRVRTDNTPSLDRINPDGGYTKNNTRIISWLANNIKNRASSPEQLEKIAQYMRKCSEENEKVVKLSHSGMQ